MAGTTRLELATSAVTGQRSNQLNYVPALGTGERMPVSLSSGLDLFECNKRSGEQQYATGNRQRQ
jgi:hypothetical protein